MKARRLESKASMWITVVEQCAKNPLIQVRTLEEEAFGVTLSPNNSCELLQFDGDE